ncbi:MAG: hypothetical protein ACXAB7_12455 [Candidatus Kariarchaeaceae archaeon]|jgi:hypothetical protein
MNRPGAFQTLFALIGDLSLLFSLAIGYQGLQDLMDDNEDLAEAIGDIIGLIIVIGFWWFFTAVAFLFLAIGGLHRQNKLILFVTTLIIIGHWALFVVPLALEMIDLESDVGGIIAFALPILLVTCLDFLGLMKWND